MYSQNSIMYRTEIFDMENFEQSATRDPCIKTNFQADNDIVSNEDLFNMSMINSEIDVFEHSPKNGNNQIENNNESNHNNFSESQNIYSNLIQSMLPCCLTLLLSFSSNFVSLYFIGKLNNSNLVSGLGLAFLW